MEVLGDLVHTRLRNANTLPSSTLLVAALHLASIQASTQANTQTATIRTRTECVHDGVSQHDGQTLTHNGGNEISSMHACGKNNKNKYQQKKSINSKHIKDSATQYINGVHGSAAGLDTNNTQHTRDNTQHTRDTTTKQHTHDLYSPGVWVSRMSVMQALQWLEGELTWKGVRFMSILHAQEPQRVCVDVCLCTHVFVGRGCMIVCV